MIVKRNLIVKFAIMAGLLIIAFSSQKIKWKNIGSIAIISILLACLWWGPVIIKSLSGESQIALRNNAQITGDIVNTSYIAKNIFSPTTGPNVGFNCFTSFCVCI